MRQEFVRFLLVGAINTLLSYVAYLFLLAFVSYLIAYSIAYCLGIVLAYFLGINFIFKKRVSLISFLRFPMVYVIQYALGTTMLWLLVEKAGASPTVSMIGVIIITVPVTFLFSRLILNAN